MTHVFDELHRIAALKTSGATETDVTNLREAFGLLLHKNEAIPELDSRNLTAIASQLVERVKLGSKLLGDAILRSSDLIESRNIIAAKQELQKFIDRDPPAFYARIAYDRLEKLGRIGV